MGEHVASDEKSVAIKITYQDVNKTLKDADVVAVHEQVLSALEKEHNAILRK